jgi:hypothetical protein
LDPSTAGCPSAIWSARPATRGDTSIDSFSSTSAYRRRGWPRSSGSSVFIANAQPVCPFDLLKADLYDHYYDQARFTREFKPMTGHPPQMFMRDVSNEFGRRLARKVSSA